MQLQHQLQYQLQRLKTLQRAVARRSQAESPGAGLKSQHRTSYLRSTFCPDLPTLLEQHCTAQSSQLALYWDNINCPDLPMLLIQHCTAESP